jgi:DegV family protein with EDD domain
MPDRRTVIVTDSTASLPPETAEAHGIVVVPLQVVIGATSYDEGPDGATPDLVAEALRKFTPVSTSRPNPAALQQVYEKVAADGAGEILSIHLSAEMSGTHESAVLAAQQAPVPVTVVDTRQVGVATGYAALAAAAVLEAGGTVTAAVAAARERAAASSSLFYVDTLEYLRRGGRIGAASALLGGALAVKPLLRVEDGRIDSFEKVRTSGRALHRLEDLAVQAAGEQPVEVTVAHLASPDRAHALAERLAGRLDVVGGVHCAELGAVLGAHVGPGMVAVCVVPSIGAGMALSTGSDG